MPQIDILRNEIEQLNAQINDWETDIEVLQGRIDDARNEIAESEAEIARLESERSRENLITQLTEALTSMSNEELAGLVSSLTNGETPTITPAPIENHPTLQYVDVSTRWGDVRIEIPEDRPSTWLAPEEFNELVDLPSEFSDADMTIAGVRHQELLGIHHYVPKIGEVIRLEKETETSNCFGVLIANEENGFEEDQAIGILPAAGRGKDQEIIDAGLPCICHQDMWNDPDLDELYEVTGVVIGQYVTIRKVESVVPATEEEVERVEDDRSEVDIATLDLDTLRGTATTKQEACRVFRDEMPDHCTVLPMENGVIDMGAHGFIVYYNNHRANTMENMRQAVIVPKTAE